MQDYLTINGEAGGKDLPKTPWSIQMLPGEIYGQTLVGGPVDDAKILSVNEDDTSPYEGMNADYTWDKF